MPSRANALKTIKVGDVIFGLGTGGQEKLLLVHDVDQAGFSARHITTQTTLRFDRNGKTRLDADGGQCTIRSTAVLPPKDHAVAIGLDQKMGSPRTYPDTKLSKAEIELLLTHGAYFKAHVLPQE